MDGVKSEQEEAADRRQRPANGSGPSDGDGACRLLALPPALLSLVAGRLESSDQRSLRSCSRTARASVQLRRLKVRRASAAPPRCRCACSLQPPSCHLAFPDHTLPSPADRWVQRGRRVRGGGGRQPRAPLPGVARAPLLAAGARKIGQEGRLDAAAPPPRRRAAALRRGGEGGPAAGRRRVLGGRQPLRLAGARPGRHSRRQRVRGGRGGGADESYQPGVCFGSGWAARGMCACLRAAAQTCIKRSRAAAAAAAGSPPTAPRTSFYLVRSRRGRC
jgi:hypothetical protein